MQTEKNLPKASEALGLEEGLQHRVAGTWPPAIDAMPWAFVLWSLAALSSLLFSRALSPALRGAFVGKGDWISLADFVGARASQLAAVGTILLLVHFGLTAVRASRSKLMALGAAFLGAVPAMILMLAQKSNLPNALVWSAALCAGLALLLCSKNLHEHIGPRWIVALCGVSLLCTAISATEYPLRASSRLQALLFSLESASAWGAFLLLMLQLLKNTKRRPWVVPMILGVALLLYASTHAASREGASASLLLIGRGLSELSPYATLGSAAPFAIACVLASVLRCLVVRRAALFQLTTSLLVLGTLLPCTPLVIAWQLLCAFFAVVLAGSERKKDSPSTRLNLQR